MRIWRETSDGSLEFVSPTNHQAGDLELSASNNQLNLVIEGINGAATTNIVVIITEEGVEIGRDTVAVTVVVPNIGVNNSNNTHDFDAMTHDDLRPGVPDVEFEIDERDEMVENQGEGFRFWWSRDNDPANPGRVTMDGIVDLAPFVVDIPQALVDAGFVFSLKVDVGEMYVYPAASPSANRRDYLQRVATATAQINQVPNGQRLAPGHPALISPVHAGKTELVFKCLGSEAQAIHMSLIAQEPPPAVGIPGNQQVIDTVLLTINDTRTYWHFQSTRLPAGQSQPSVPFTYPIDGDTLDSNNYVSIKQYPYATVAPGSGMRDPSKLQHLIWVHGYNVSQDDARGTFNEMYRRLFWLGYRGNFIGLTWHSDEGGSTAVLRFDTQVQNALQSSPSFWGFLSSQVRGSWAVPAKNINIVAHSLGNLVVYDALRINRKYDLNPNTPTQIANNVVSIESATWPEAYQYETIIAAAGGINYVTAPSVPITYGVAQLRQQSWAFWFGQAGFEVPGAISGEFYHSFLPTDPVLEAMRINDWEQRGFFVPPFTRWWHFIRTNVPGVAAGHRRQPSEDAPQPRLYDVVPTLMLPNTRVFGSYGPLGIWRYLYTHLNQPVGALPNPMPVGTMNNFPAATGGWSPPVALQDIGAHSRYVLQSYPSLYSWFRIYLAGRGNVLSGEPVFTPAIPIGEE